jgi:hypothetical protein
MRNFSDENCRENKRQLLFSITFFEQRFVYEIMWKYIAEPARPQMTYYGK